MSQLNLAQLQNLIKRDPEGYKDDFTRQLSHFSNLMQIVKLDPSLQNDQFEELVIFLSHVSNCFPEQLQEVDFVGQVISFLRQNYAVLNPATRKSLVKALQLLRSKSTNVNKQKCQKQHGKGIMEDPLPLLSLSFFLLKCRDKGLRELLKTFIINDIKAINAKGKNNKVNKALQNFMFSMISQVASGLGGLQAQSELADAIDGAIDCGDASDIAAKYSLDICIDLYRKQIWDDAKTVNIIADALNSPHTKVLVTALKFFLGTDQADKDAESSDDEAVPDVRKVKFRSTITKTSKGNTKKVEKALKLVKRKEQKSQRVESFNFSALHLLNDSQGVAEKLFQLLTRGHVSASSQSKKDENGVVTSKMSQDIKFEIRIMIMNLISRLIGLHQLLILNFYPFMVRYLKPQQPEVTQILAILAQSVHSLIPPEEYLCPLIKSLVNNFCIDSFSAEVIQVGLNTIREICARNVGAMTPEVLHYLCTFKSHKQKGVNIACRGLVTLFRDAAPDMLPRKDRGKVLQMEMSRGLQKKSKGFAQSKAEEGVAGAEFLNDSQSEAGSNDGSILELSDAESEASSSPVGKTNIMHYGLEFTQLSEDDASEIEDNQDNNGSFSGSEADTEDDVSEADETTAELESIRTGRSQTRIESERILTQEDFARITELKQQKEALRLAEGPVRKKRNRSPSPSEDTNEANNVVSNSSIRGFQKRSRSTYEERVASMKEGAVDRLKYGSRKGKHNETKGSTTNKQKAKGKNFLMIAHKRSVVAKKKMSLRDKQKKLRKHVETIKKQK